MVRDVEGPTPHHNEEQDQPGPFRPLTVAEMIHLPRAALHDYRDRAERMVKSKLAWWLNYYGYELISENGEFRVIVQGPVLAEADGRQRVFKDYRTAVRWINEDIARRMGEFIAGLGRTSVDLWAQVVLSWFERTVNGHHHPLPFMLLGEEQAPDSKAGRVMKCDATVADAIREISLHAAPTRIAVTHTPTGLLIDVLA
jgi:hypothetical protein